MGIPLKNWDINIYRGILTGYNEAFIIDKQIRNKLIADSPKCEEIIRPILLGRDIKRYRYDWNNLYIINSHNGIKEKNIPPINLEKDYPPVFNYLQQYEKKLKKRYDQGNHWSNLRNCSYLEEFQKPKIAWGNLALEPQFCMIPEGFFINAPSPFFSTDNLYLLGVLNSAIADFYIKRQGVSRNGGYMEYKPMFIEKLPIPEASEEQQISIIHLVNKLHDCLKFQKPTREIEDEINRKIADLYHLTLEERDHVFGI